MHCQFDPCTVAEDGTVQVWARNGEQDSWEEALAEPFGPGLLM